MSTKPPMTVTVTGAAGQIGYALLFRIASGAMLGADQPVKLNLLEIPPAMDALGGTIMELDDCAFPLVTEIIGTSDADEGFGDADVALLVGAMPRRKGMERSDLLEANGSIFTGQGAAISRSAKSDIRVLVVGNPANTNALIAMNNAPNTDDRNFTAMTRLDHNRALAQLAKKANCTVADITNMTIWGNHSSTQYPDLFNAKVDGQIAAELIDDQDWIESTYIPTVASRGAAIIEARGASSAASAANAAIDHMSDWVLGTVEGDWVSMSVPSDGSYGVPEGVISSFPCVCKDGDYEIVQGVELNEFSETRFRASVDELVGEREEVSGLGLI